MTRIVLPAALRQYASGASSVELDHVDGMSLAVLLDSLAAGHAALARRIRDEHGELRRFVNVYVGAEDVRRLGGLSTPVPAHGQVLVLPSVAGG